MATKLFQLAWGDDLLLIEEAIDALAAKLTAADAGGGGAPDRVRLRAEGRGAGDAVTLIGEIRERLGTGGLFGGGTLITVAGAGKLARSKELRTLLAAALDGAAPGNALLLIDHRARRPNLRGTRPDGPGELALVVEAAGGTVVPCVSPGPGELPSWLMARAKAAGREIAGDAAKAISERLGSEVREPDLDRSGIRMSAAIELEKLLLAVPSGPVSLKAVEALVADRGIGSLFAFADAVIARSGPLVARHLGRAVSEPGPVVVATLHRKLRDLAQIHGAVVEEGGTVAQVARSLGMHEFPAGKLAEAARRWSANEIVAAIEGLVELDAIAKGDGERAWGPALTRWSAART